MDTRLFFFWTNFRFLLYSFLLLFHSHLYSFTGHIWKSIESSHFRCFFCTCTSSSRFSPDFSIKIYECVFLDAICWKLRSCGLFGSKDQDFWGYLAVIGYCIWLVRVPMRWVSPKYTNFCVQSENHISDDYIYR